MDGVRLGLGGDVEDRVDPRPGPVHERRAELTQVAVEFDEAFVEECLPVRRGVAPLGVAVSDEDRDDIGGRRHETRVVVEAEISGEDVQCAHVMESSPDLFEDAIHGARASR